MGQLLEMPSGDEKQTPGAPLVRNPEERTERLVAAVGDKEARVERLAQVGASPEDIAAELQIPLKRLHKRFRRQLERGAVQGKHDVLEKLFENASSGANAAATSLWVKARCGWRDTGVSSNSPSIIHSVLEIVTKLTCPDKKQS